MSDAWMRVYRGVNEMNERLRAAKTEEQCQVIGTLGREILISLAQAVYDRNVHGPAHDGVAPSETDAKRMLDTYIDSALLGGANTEARQFAKSAVALAPAVLHRRTATLRDAALCAVATESMVRVIKVLSEQRVSAGAETVGPSVVDLPEPTSSDTSTSWRFPKIPVGRPQQCWIEILAEAFETGVRPPDHVLLRQHRERLGSDFRPETVDPRLVAEGGKDITPLGLWHVNPDTPWLHRIDRVFRYVKQIIQTYPTLDQLSVPVVATKLGLTQRDVSHSLHLLRTCHGWCCASAGGNQDAEHYLTLYSTFSVGKDQVFRFYERFSSIDEVIEGTLLAAVRPREF